MSLLSTYEDIQDLGSEAKRDEEGTQPEQIGAAPAQQQTVTAPAQTGQEPTPANSSYGGYIQQPQQQEGQSYYPSAGNGQVDPSQIRQQPQQLPRPFNPRLGNIPGVPQDRGYQLPGQQQYISRAPVIPSDPPLSNPMYGQTAVMNWRNVPEDPAITAKVSDIEKTRDLIKQHRDEMSDEQYAKALDLVNNQLWMVDPSGRHAQEARALGAQSPIDNYIAKNTAFFNSKGQKVRAGSEEASVIMSLDAKGTPHFHTVQSNTGKAEEAQKKLQLQQQEMHSKQDLDWEARERKYEADREAGHQKHVLSLMEHFNKPEESQNDKGQTVKTFPTSDKLKENVKKFLPPDVAKRYIDNDQDAIDEHNQAFEANLQRQKDQRRAARGQRPAFGMTPEEQSLSNQEFEDIVAGRRPAEVGPSSTMPTGTIKPSAQTPAAMPKSKQQEAWERLKNVLGGFGGE